MQTATRKERVRWQQYVTLRSGHVFRFADATQVIVRYPGFKLSSFEQLLAVAKSHYQLCQGALPRG